jgi:hypothetical protein
MQMHWCGNGHLRAFVFVGTRLRISYVLSDREVRAQELSRVCVRPRDVTIVQHFCLSCI